MSCNGPGIASRGLKRTGNTPDSSAKSHALTSCKRVTTTTRFGKDGIPICDPNRAGEGAAGVFEKIYDKAV